MTEENKEIYEIAKIRGALLSWIIPFYRWYLIFTSKEFEKKELISEIVFQILNVVTICFSIFGIVLMVYWNNQMEYHRTKHIDDILQSIKESSIVMGGFFFMVLAFGMTSCLILVLVIINCVHARTLARTVRLKNAQFSREKIYQYGLLQGNIGAIVPFYLIYKLYRFTRRAGKEQRLLKVFIYVYFFIYLQAFPRLFTQGLMVAIISFLVITVCKIYLVIRFEKLIVF